MRRHVAEMSADLEAARLITYHSAWLSDTQGPTAQTTAALYRAKYMVRRAEGGYRITGRKMFASMLEAADFVLVMACPEGATSPSAGIILMLPREAEGRTVDPNWDVLGMRATRSDSLILDECWVPESAAVFRSDDVRRFRHSYLNWFWGSYTPVYLGVAQAAFDELRREDFPRTAMS